MDRWRAAALCAGLAIACGGDPEPAPDAGYEQSESGASDPGNSAPVIESVRLEPAEPRPGERVTAYVEASDPEGDKVELDYQWRVGGWEVDEAHGKQSMVVAGDREPGSWIEVTVVASDDSSESPAMTASVPVGNMPPQISNIELSPFGKPSAGTDITANPKAVDPEGNDIEYRYAWRVNGSPVGEDGPTLSASKFKRGDRIEVEVVASDRTDESVLATPPIEVVNAAPRIVSQPGPLGSDGVFRYKLQVEDPDGDALFRYRLVKGPDGMKVGFDDGQMTWQPPSDAPGSADVEIEVEDRFGGKAVHRFGLEYSFAPEKAAPPAKRGEKASARSDEDGEGEAESD